jgi:hypothetical protein
MTGKKPGAKKVLGSFKGGNTRRGGGKPLSEDEKKEEIRREQVVGLYRTRLSHLKQAQTFVKEDKIPMAVDAYTKYLGILALYFDTSESKLSPNLFDPEKDLTELLLISHAYWDLAKSFDRSPHLQYDCIRCLEQFIKFSIGFKYQHVNAQIVRKFNNKKQAHNPKAFEAAYLRIQVSSKKCYIASSCFGEDHPVTEDLRAFKQSISHSKYGLDFIDFYYSVSPKIIDFFNAHPKVKSISEFFLRPTLLVFAWIASHYVDYKQTHS